MLVNDQVHKSFIIEELNLITIDLSAVPLFVKSWVWVVCVSLVAWSLIPCQAKVCQIHDELTMFFDTPSKFLRIVFTVAFYTGVLDIKSKMLLKKKKKK